MDDIFPYFPDDGLGNAVDGRYGGGGDARDALEGALGLSLDVVLDEGGTQGEVLREVRGALVVRHGYVLPTESHSVQEGASVVTKREMRTADYCA